MRRSDDKITITTLDSGLRLVHRLRQGSAVDYCGAVVKAGSRDDPAHLLGLAHFVEHTIFKGTQRRQSWHIINRMERIGGELNAYTTKEETVVYTAAPAGNMPRAMELIADLVINSRFPEAELSKEREVVADEINSYLDTPADAVFDDFEDLIYAGTPLGHNILGNEKQIMLTTPDECRAYLQKWYTAPNMDIFYYGSASADRVRKAVESHFSSLPRHQALHTALQSTPAPEPFSITRQIGSHQAHTVMGALIGGMFSPERFAMALTTNILGGPGMNSLLNVELREKRGLVYSVEASSSIMSDTGLCTIYFGCDPKDTPACTEIVKEQLHRLSTYGISDRALKAAKKQYLGQLAVASDNGENVGISTGRALLWYGTVRSSAEVRQTIESLTPEQISEAAKRLSHLSSLTLT